MSSREKRPEPDRGTRPENGYSFVPLYYFDTCDDKGFVPDDTGLEFGTLEKAKAEAARALVDIARDRVPGPDRLVFVVEVRDENKQPLVEARLTIEIAHKAGTVD